MFLRPVPPVGKCSSLRTGRVGWRGQGTGNPDASSLFLATFEAVVWQGYPAKRLACPREPGRRSAGLLDTWGASAAAPELGSTAGVGWGVGAGEK